MGEIDGEFGRVRDALERPAIRLLSRPTAPAVVAIFRTTFGRDVQFVAADRFHLQVEEYLGELAARGARIPAGGDERGGGRTLCREWVHDQWLVRTSTDDGEEQYSLTSHALEAVSLVDGLAHDRALISESRLTMILDSVRRWALQADPDRDEHLRRIDAQLAELQAERERVAAGGTVVAASDDRMQDGYANIADLIRQLPSDFRRVEESVIAMHRRIVEDFRNDTRPIGEILDDYLRRTDELMTATAEGRAFEGAFELLRNDDLLQDLKRDLSTILDHPFSARLGPAELRGFRGAVGIIRQGIDDVLAQRRRLTATLRDHIVHHDVVQDRELDTTLRALNQRLGIWMRTAGPRATVDLPLLPETIDIEHLRERFYDPDVEVAPPPITTTVERTDGAAMSLDILRSQGGPLLDELRAGLLDAVTSGAEDAHAAFSGLDPELRRPVELFGLVHLMTQLGTYDEQAPRRRYETVRPDGTTTAFELPAFPLGEAGVAALTRATTTTTTAPADQAGRGTE
ncbi:DUF3375 domain-containing protein [Plantibacter sp. ME-Dv--P-122b]|uniref:DUF3375 domain-containing protein n=1 Tax=Plantibacter sp. ME-Dv--P-122b TaxID=3040300 RepID=UPI00254AE7FC|nr:DUF3375 domain-containing protein [Plantibacter sp. ME-Dv--P-122b]